MPLILLAPVALAFEPLGQPIEALRDFEHEPPALRICQVLGFLSQFGGPQPIAGGPLNTAHHPHLAHPSRGFGGLMYSNTGDTLRASPVYRSNLRAGFYWAAK